MVVGGEDRRRDVGLREEPLPGRVALARVPASLDDGGDGQAGVEELGPPPLDARPRVEPVRRAGDVGDVPVPEADEVGGGVTRSLGARRLHR